MARGIIDYKTKAFEIFQVLTCDPSQNLKCDPSTSVLGDVDYWQLGCTFDTVLDYMKAAILDSTITKETAQAIVSAVYTGFRNKQGAWYDDYSWWGILAAKAFDYSYHDVFGDANLENYKSIARECWCTVQNGKPAVPESKGAPNAYASCDHTLFTTITPRFEGGTWQYDIFACPRTNDPRVTDPMSPIRITHPCNASPATLGPYQQSVMNGLYLVLSQRMADQGLTSPIYAAGQYSFIEQWTNQLTVSPVENLMLRFPNSGGVIRERVSTYARGYHVWDYFENAAWCGDQGLFIGGLLDYYNTSGDANALSLLMTIIDGTLTEMKTVAVVNGLPLEVINYCYQEGRPFSDDPGDYSSGVGVFFRYLLYCFNNNVDIKNMIITNPRYITILSNTAEAAYYNALPAVKNANPLFIQFNMLSILNTMIQIFASAEELPTGTKPITQNKAS
jgi:hypothetical protein